MRIIILVWAVVKGFLNHDIQILMYWQPFIDEVPGKSSILTPTSLVATIKIMSKTLALLFVFSLVAFGSLFAIKQYKKLSNPSVLAVTATPEASTKVQICNGDWLSNPSFEDDRDKDLTPDCWFGNWHYYDGTVRKLGRDGKNVLEFNGTEEDDPPFSEALSQTVFRKVLTGSNTKMYVGVWHKGNVISKTFQGNYILVRAYIFDNRPYHIVKKEWHLKLPESGTYDWRYSYGEITLPVNVQINYFLVGIVTSHNSGSFLFDDVHFSQLRPAATTAPEILAPVEPFYDNILL